MGQEFVLVDIYSLLIAVESPVTERRTLDPLPFIVYDAASSRLH